MQDVLEEIRDLLEDSINTIHSAESGTTATNIKITAHGLSVGDFIYNSTRSQQRVITVVVDANNVTVETVTAQTSGDSITFLKIKKFYAGKVFDSALPVNILPVVMVYGESTSLVADRLTTNRDKYEYVIKVELVTSAYQLVKEAGVEADNILKAQKQKVLLMEERDSNQIPIARSILGVLRRNIRGTNYLFSLPSGVEYPQENDSGTVYHRAILSMNAVSNYNSRS